MTWTPSLDQTLAFPQPSRALRLVLNTAGAWARKAAAVSHRNMGGLRGGPSVRSAHQSPMMVGGNDATAMNGAARLAMPLRVLRVVDCEASGERAGGRMRISGRMADVCAELDRLVEREAAMQKARLAA